MILDQQDRDNAVQDLLKKLSDVYAFMTEDKRLGEIPTMKDLYGKLIRKITDSLFSLITYFRAPTSMNKHALK